MYPQALLCQAFCFPPPSAPAVPRACEASALQEADAKDRQATLPSIRSSLLFVASGLIVLNSNDSYYLKPLGSPDPEHHVLYRAEHLPIEGGTCGHSEHSGSNIADLIRVVKPVRQRVRPGFPLVVLPNGPYVTGGVWGAPGTSPG